MGFLYALVAVGLTIIWGLMEMINFAHGEFLMLGMFGAWWASVAFGLDPLVALVPVGLAMYGLGVLVYRQLMRRVQQRSEEHTSELQSRLHLVCRLLLEKKKRKNVHNMHYHD